MTSVQINRQLVYSRAFNWGGGGRQNAATRRNMRREERVTVQGPVKEQQPDGMSHRGVNRAPLNCGGGGLGKGVH